MAITYILFVRSPLSSMRACLNGNRMASIEWNNHYWLAHKIQPDSIRFGFLVHLHFVHLFGIRKRVRLYRLRLCAPHSSIAAVAATAAATANGDK